MLCLLCVFVLGTFHPVWKYLCALRADIHSFKAPIISTSPLFPTHSLWQVWTDSKTEANTPTLGTALGQGQKHLRWWQHWARGKNTYVGDSIGQGAKTPTLVTALGKGQKHLHLWQHWARGKNTYISDSIGQWTRTPTLVTALGKGLKHLH
jgi:hypothetical protein